MHYAYKVIPAPDRGTKAPGARSAEARFAHAVETLINDLAAEGWEYLRSDTLPSEERVGLTQSRTVWRNLLVFRRPGAEGREASGPRRPAPPSEPHGVPASPATAGLASDGTSREDKAARMGTPLSSAPPPDVARDRSVPPLTEVLPDALRARAARLRKDRSDGG